MHPITKRTRRFKQRRPVTYAYQTLKDNSKRRGIEFTLTLQEFNDFCYESEYLQGKGRSKSGYSIDRMDNNKGYTRDNIKVMLFADNCRKGAKKQLYYDWQSKYATVAKVNNGITPDPFA